MGWWGGAGRAALRALRGGARYSLGRVPQPPPVPPPPTLGAADLERADAWMLRKALESGFLSWFRNGLLATGVGVIAHVQSDTGRDAAYGFFALGGLCVSWASLSYSWALLRLRRPLLLPLPGALGAAGGAAIPALLWAAALALYVGRLEVEVGTEEPPPE
ncbi:transmembrane protein 160 isoform X2 [Patagioenas fasciata]|uniref:transmembrane protein 160 isoform X2 n=1 Tax=Patagioenas fasciata TaxID=372321 RepID=UPI003A99C703